MTLKSQEREHFPNVHFFYFILIEIGSQLSKFQKLSFDHRSTIKWSFKIISPFLQKYVPQQKKGFIIRSGFSIFGYLDFGLDKSFGKR